MIKTLKFTVALFALSLPLAAHAQSQMQSTVEAENGYSQEELDQIAAPIALYPDALVTQIFVAATHPLDVVEANRWLKKPENAQLSGEALADAVVQQPWDSSVKALVNVPQIVAMMNTNLEWTEELGGAFLEQGEDLTESVQRLRQMAAMSGYLTSTPQQTVAMAGDGDIDIVPADPQLVYVPTYNPALVYGSWPYPDYQPYYFAPPPGAQTSAITYATNYIVIERLWRVPPRDLHRHRIADNGPHIPTEVAQEPTPESSSWARGPKHRVVRSSTPAPAATAVAAPVVPIAGPAVPPVVSPSARPVVPVAGPAVPSVAAPVPQQEAEQAVAPPAASGVQAQNRGKRDKQARGYFHSRFRPEDPANKETSEAAPIAAPLSPAPAAVIPAAVTPPAAQPIPAAAPQPAPAQPEPAPPQQQQQTDNGMPALPFEAPRAHAERGKPHDHRPIPASASPGDNANQSSWRNDRQ